MQVRKIQREAGVPFAHTLGTIARQVAVILHGRAKAGRAHHRAIAAAETALGDLVPAWMIRIALKQFLDAVGIERPPHSARRARDDPIRIGSIGRGRRPTGDLLEQSCARAAADLDEEVVPIALHEFGQRKIKAAACLWTGLHRNAEAGASGLRAIDGHNEGIPPARRVSGVGIGAIAENPVLYRDRVEFAGSDPEKRVIAIASRGIRYRDAVLPPPHRPQTFDRRMQEALPRMRSYCKPEHRLVVAPLQPIASGFLLVGPTGRQISDARNRIIDDRAVAHRRAEHFVVAADQRVDQRLQALAADEHGGLVDWGRAHEARMSLQRRKEESELYLEPFDFPEPSAPAEPRISRRGTRASSNARSSGWGGPLRLAACSSARRMRLPGRPRNRKVRDPFDRSCRVSPGPRS